MTKSEVEDETTAALLIDSLRRATGRSDLELAAPPTPLIGGFYAEMLRFRLVDPPDDLDRELVARIVPDPSAGEWEATIQRHVAQQGFATPAVRLTVPETGPLGRYLIVMDHIEGRPPMSGLTPRTVVGQAPALLRHLPHQLARLAADLHALDPEPLAADLAALDGGMPMTTTEFVRRQAADAARAGRPELAAAGEQLLATEPTSAARVIAHGDLHPFNVLLASGGPALVDWTVARVAHPGFTIGFAHLMLANPPIPLPRAGALLVRPVARNLAARFITSYRSLTDGTSSAVDDVHLDWHRNVHALRILVELAGWDAAGTRPTSHPWLVLEPTVRRALRLRP